MRRSVGPTRGRTGNCKLRMPSSSPEVQQPQREPLQQITRYEYVGRLDEWNPMEGKMGHSRLLLASITCGFFVASASSTLAQDDECAVPIKYQAFNVYDVNTRNEYEGNPLFTTACRTEWENLEEYKEQTASLGSGANYEGISGSLDLDWRDEKNTLHQIYVHMCQLKDYSLKRFVVASSHTVITDKAVAAWKDCVLNRTGVFSSILIPPDNDTAGFL